MKMKIEKNSKKLKNFFIMKKKIKIIVIKILILIIKKSILINFILQKKLN